MVRFVNRKPLAAIGLWFHERTVQEFLWGNLLGFLMIASIFLVLYCLGDVELATKGLGWSDCLYIVSSSILFFAVGALIEEVIFRGYPFQTLIQGMTLIPAIFLMAVLFGLAHLGNPNTSTFGIVNVVLAAIWLSIAYLRTRGLWLPFGLHLGWNFSQTTLFSFPTSGLEFTEHKLLASTVTAPEWLAGGRFGPEGGALATAAIIVCTWYLLKARRFAAAEGIITLESVEDLQPLPENETQNPGHGEAT
jgi:membrane protease YdiL (CAAX protease family)